jgi:hypothetical protein
MLQDKATHPANKYQQITYSTKRLSKQLLGEIGKSLKSIDSHGSVEIYVQDATVTQITVRNIRKTNGVMRLAV